MKQGKKKRKGGTKRGLTQRNKVYADAYCGDSAEAAKVAGISENHARKLMMSTTAASITPAGLAVQERIRKREETEVRPNVASRLERQEFWTQIQRGDVFPTAEQLRASELLGKSELDFGERRQEVQAQSLADIAALMYVHRKKVDSKAIEGESDEV